VDISKCQSGHLKQNVPWQVIQKNKDYWCAFNILKGFNNINAAWEELSVNCLNGVWWKLLPELCTTLQDLNQRRTLLKEVSRLAQEDGLDELHLKM